MVKITLYNIGEYKKKQFLLLFFILLLCLLFVFQIYQKSQKKTYIWNIAYQCFVYSPYGYGYRHKCVSFSNLLRYTPPTGTGTGTNAYHSATCYDILPLRVRVQAQMRIIQQLATIYVFPHSIYIIYEPEYDGFAV